MSMDRDDDRWIEEFLERGAILGAHGNELWIGWGDFSWHMEPIAGRRAFLAADFFLRNAHPWLHPRHCRTIGAGKLIEKLAPFTTALSPLRWKSFEQALFGTIFDDLMAEIRAGRIEKGVPVIFDSTEAIIGTIQRATLIDSILRAIRDTPVTIYGFWEYDHGMLGASPEILFEQTAADTLLTMALAGTQSSSAPDAQLLASEKDRLEHELVVKDIVRSLAELGSVQVADTTVLHLPSVSHLCTPITAKLAHSFSFSQTVRCLHATPAVCGVPREAAWSWLERQQDCIDRERFGAPFGALWNETEARCIVAIRGIQWTQSQVRMGAGCGIVAQSQVHLEWEELQLKLRSIRKVMGL